MRVEDQACRWVERVFHRQPEGRRVIRRSKSADPGGRERSKSAARRGWGQSSAPCGQAAAQKRCQVGRTAHPEACEEKPCAEWRQRGLDRYAVQARGQHRGREKCWPLTQAPAETAAVAAPVASRTKRATVRAEVKISAKIDALALLERPNQGERFTPCRAWSALRLSA
jgi:hypothetical protein